MMGVGTIIGTGISIYYLYGYQHSKLNTK